MCKCGRRHSDTDQAVKDAIKLKRLFRQRDALQQLKDTGYSIDIDGTRNAVDLDDLIIDVNIKIENLI